MGQAALAQWLAAFFVQAAEWSVGDLIHVVHDYESRLWAPERIDIDDYVVHEYQHGPTW